MGAPSAPDDPEAAGDGAGDCDCPAWSEKGNAAIPALSETTPFTKERLGSEVRSLAFAEPHGSFKSLFIDRFLSNFRSSSHAFVRSRSHR
jgi:hypothetical protein